MNNRQIFRPISLLLIAVAIGVICAIGWYLWQKHEVDSKSAATTQSTYSKFTQSSDGSLKIVGSKLPDGWTVDREEPGAILLVSEASGCSVDAISTTDTAESNSPDVDQNKQTVAAIESKGYTVAESSGAMTITTANGEKQLDAQLLAITGQDNPLSQEYAYIAKSNSFTRIALSCPSAADLPSAEKGLLAIQFAEQ